MGLKHIKLPEATVEFPGGNFAVRGLSLDDISFLLRRHGQRLQALFAELMGKPVGAELTVDSVASFAMPLIEAAPELAAEIVACAADGHSPEEIAIARSLPLPTQIDALEKTLNLTFEAAGGPKKLLETVIRLAQGTTGLLQEISGQKA